LGKKWALRFYISHNSVLYAVLLVMDALQASLEGIYVDVGVGSSKTTWVFQVGSIRSVKASPSRFFGTVGITTSHFKST